MKDRLTTLKTPPHSLEAEQAVLAGLMADSAKFDLVAEIVSAGDFYRKEHRLIWEAMCSQVLTDKPIDVITISEVLRMTNQLKEAGGIEMLEELLHSSQSSANAVSYAKIIHERSMLRHMISAAHGIADSGYNSDGRDAAELLQAAEQAIFRLTTRSSSSKRELRPIAAAVKSSIARLDDRHQNKGQLFGRSTGFADIDDKTMGLVDDDLIILAGRPSMGKTTLAMNIAENIAIDQDALVIVFSLEMPEWKLTDRMICSVGKIDNRRHKKGELHNEEWDNLSLAVKKLAKAKIYVDDDTTLTSDQLAGRARRIVAMAGERPALIVVDYLQILKDVQERGDSSGTNRTTKISGNLKNLARLMTCPVIALSQLNRSLENRSNKRPQSSDLRDSGAIEQDADVIMMAYRDEIYFPDTTNAKGVVEIIFTKLRDGEIGKVELSSFLWRNRFENRAKQQRMPNSNVSPPPVQQTWMDREDEPTI